jgi:hypothetical protein
MRASWDDGATAMTAATVDWLLRDASAANVGALLPSVLGRQRQLRAALQAEFSRSATDSRGDAADEGRAALREFAALSSRLILLSQTVPSLRAEVADELFAAVQDFRGLARAEGATCFLLERLTGSGVLSRAQRQELASFALALLDRAAGPSQEEGDAESTGDVKGVGPLLESDQMLICALTIIAEELQPDGMETTSPRGTPQSDLSTAAAPPDVSLTEEDLATRAFNGASSLLDTALEQLAGTTLGGHQHGRGAQRRWSEGVLQAACRVAIVCAHSRCGSQHQSRCVQLLVASISTFGRIQPRQRLPSLSQHCPPFSPASSIDSRDMASLSPQSPGSPFQEQMLTSLSRRSSAGHPITMETMHQKLGADLGPGGRSLCISAAADGILSAAVEGLVLFGCSHVEKYGATAASSLVALCVEEQQLCMVPTGARARLRQQAVAAVCQVLRAASASPRSPHAPLGVPPQHKSASHPDVQTAVLGPPEGAPGVAAGSHKSLVTDTLYSIADSLFHYSGGSGDGSAYRGMGRAQDSANLRQASPRLGGGGRVSSRDAVLLLGAMACHLGLEVTEHVQALMMEGLQSLPAALHELLLEQLVHMALVAPSGTLKEPCMSLRYAKRVRKPTYRPEQRPNDPQKRANDTWWARQRTTARWPT